jgi:aminoglycoside phosphotransferase (APT) family kinase protein
MTPKDIEPSIHAALSRALSQLGRSDWQLTGATRLSGGAINQNFLIELQTGQGEPVRWVMRRGQSAAIPGTHTREHEYALFEFAHGLGLAVPKPIALVQTDDGLVSFFEFRSGQADGRKLVQWLGVASDSGSDSESNSGSERAAQTARAITRQLGVELGRLHHAQASALAGNSLGHTLGPRPAHSIEAAMVLVEKSFACVRQPTSYLTYATQQVLQEGRALASQHPNSAASVCHNDFRLGNLMMDPQVGQLTAVLDWEFAAWGDVMADIGWLTAPCWRFGGHHPVAGFGRLQDLIEGVCQTIDDQQAGLLQQRVDGELPFWQRYAQLRWAIIAAQQGERVVTGDAEALELTITGCMSASLVEPVVSHYLGQDVAHIARDQAHQSGGPRDASAIDATSVRADHAEADRLLAEVAAHLKLHLASQLSGSQKYSALMAANAIRLARGVLVHDRRRGAAIHSDEDAVIQDLIRDLLVWSFKG